MFGGSVSFPSAVLSYENFDACHVVVCSFRRLLFQSRTYIIGYLWGYHLPVGYAGFIAGIMVVLYSKLALVRKLRFGSIMIVVGLFLFLSFFFWPKVYSINLL